MHHNLYKRKFPYAVVAMAIALAGCNGEGDNAKETGSPESTVPTTIVAQNATFITQHDTNYKVDLSDKVSVSDGKSFRLVEVTSLTQDAECYPLEQTEQAFTIAADTSKSCTYEYKVEVVDAPSVAKASMSSVSAASAESAPTDIAITRVAVTSTDATATSEVEWPAISAVTFVETEVTVDIKDELLFQAAISVPSGFKLSEEVSLPYAFPGAPITATVNSLRNTITYTPFFGFEGIERILFSYINESTGEVYLGTLDIAVAFDPNLGLQVEKGGTVDKVKVGETTTIDIAPFVTSLDDDRFQLIYVDSFNAATAPLNPGFLGNTQLTFETSVVGYHYVSFAVSDNNGAYGYGLVEVPVYDPNKAAQWSGIHSQAQFFTAPLTTSEALMEQIEYSGSFVDYSFTPELSLALFNSSSAQSFCSSNYSGHLPTSTELNVLSAVDVETSNNWPVSQQYIASDAGVFKTVDMKTGLASDYVDGNFLVTCVEDEPTPF
ncbi:hypothetical protein [Vibrio sp. Sgm 5]|uniref:hypothetical protein n=1 Tax=Vibrio sp. Sgm 5 TaxID=2994387 RepID=UPI002248A27E|nr:hypothetical protein [Vibrio sp. Sgm 5]MCX2791098.1 hypothetical protein [Vibrio sp. Sgm 5]